MKRTLNISIWGLCILLVTVSGTQAQKTKKSGNIYIGYVYPAGAQQGTTVQVRIGGQRVEGAYGATVSGEGVHAKMIECRGKIGNQEMRVLKDQMKALKKAKSNEDQELKSRIQTRVKEYERKPANGSIAIISILEVTVDAGAAAGEREIRIMTPRGVSNPLPFHVGQVPEVSRKPMITSPVQILGKEELALRKRSDDEIEETIAVPCTMNGQVGSGEVNRYRFKAYKGQKLVINTLARQLVPYIADAVPGWFQPVLSLHDADGREVAFNDDFRFRPDPIILYEVPSNGEYVLTINDAIYRGREDFVYRITIGELPLITSIYPLGSGVGSAVNVKTTGWNLEGTQLKLPAKNDGAGIHFVVAEGKDFISNHVPYRLDTLPESYEAEDNNDIEHAQRVKMPIIVNGGSNRPGDWDVYKVHANAGDTIVAEVYARRLDSPLDSIVKLTDSAGNVLAVNDDHADPGSGLNTHHADSYLMVKVPKGGDYYIHLTDTTHLGGMAYAYRLRISKPRPDFELRTMPSSFHFSRLGKAVKTSKGGKKGKKGKKGKSAKSVASSANSSAVTVYAIRKDGYDGPITLRLKDAPKGFSAKEVTMQPGEDKAEFSVQTSRTKMALPVALNVEGYTEIKSRELARTAVPSEDWMQAFLWRHLVPAQELLVHAYDPSVNPPLPKRELPKLPFADELASNAKGKKGKQSPEAAKAAKSVAGRVKQLGRLYEEWLLTEDFYLLKVAEYKSYTGQ